MLLACELPAYYLRIVPHPKSTKGYSLARPSHPLTLLEDVYLDVDVSTRLSCSPVGLCCR
jgi:hypothetical protein